MFPGRRSGMYVGGRLILNDKEEYNSFCRKSHVPIFSQPWWLDAVCEPGNWGVWLCRHGDEVVAAMPYYLEDREFGTYITKPPLTQNNGILFNHPENSTHISRQKAEEKIINEACEFIAGLGLAVYEQQYRYTFDNWSPFHWNGYNAIPRYTYVISKDISLDEKWRGLSSKIRAVVRKGKKNTHHIQAVDPELFYKEHAKVFERQGLDCPFSQELWLRLWEAAIGREAGQALCAYTADGEIASLIFLVEDGDSMYQILGGNMPRFQNLDTYDALVWHGIELATERGLNYDFEGSMIKRIAKSFREYGGTPKLYFRIRKIFNPEVVLHEAELRALEIGAGEGVQNT